MQTISDLVDEIRRLSSKLASFKTLYFIQKQELEQAGQEYIALHEELDENEQVFHAAYYPVNI